MIRFLEDAVIEGLGPTYSGRGSAHGRHVFRFRARRDRVHGATLHCDVCCRDRSDEADVVVPVDARGSVVEAATDPLVVSGRANSGHCIFVRDALRVSRLD